MAFRRLICAFTLASSTAALGFGSGFYNVLNYGAVGNGSTDDTSAFQAALSDAITAGGGTVYIPTSPNGSVYLITGQLNITSGTIAIAGDPAGQPYAKIPSVWITFQPSTSVPLFNIGGSAGSSIRIANITVGQWNSNAGSVVLNTSTTPAQLSIDTCGFITSPGGNPAFINSNAPTDVRNSAFWASAQQYAIQLGSNLNSVTNNIFYSGSSIQLNGGTSIISNNRFTGGLLFDQDITITGGNQIVVANNVFNDASGVNISISSTSPIANVTISGNEISTTAANGMNIYLDAPSYTNDFLQITSNNLSVSTGASNGAYNIAVGNGVVLVRHVIVSQNIMFGAVQAAVLDNTAGASWDISNNDIFGFGSAAYGLYLPYVTQTIIDGNNISGFAVPITQASPWNLVGATGQPAFNTNWQNLGGGWAVAAFMKDSTGHVHMKGLIKATAAQPIGTTIFTLPAGYRPAESHEVPCSCGLAGVNKAGSLEIGSTGVVVTLQALALNDYINIDWTFLGEH